MAKKKTTNEFKKEVYNLVGNEYLVISEYIGSHKKIKFKHIKCNTIFTMTPNHFLHNERCPYCNIKRQTKSTKQFKKEVCDNTNNHYIVLSEYINNHTPVKIKHVDCGNIYDVTPMTFLKGHRCPKCNGGVRLTSKDFQEKMDKLTNHEFNLLTSYINNHTRVKLQHNKCGKIFEIIPSTFLKSLKCPKCNHIGLKSTEYFNKEVYELVGNDYIVMSDYKRNNLNIKMKHTECGHIYWVTPNAFLHGSRCPYCNIMKRRKTLNQFKEEVKKLEGNNYEVLGEYINTDTKIEMIHNVCGNVFYITPDNFLRGNRCNYCNTSHGERYIEIFLNKHKINFIKQYKFKNCKNQWPLPFDFYIQQNNLLIEYDGEQHYHAINFFGGNDKFLIRQKRDNIKNNYCIKNKINLLRIRYDEDIDQVLNKALKFLKEYKNKIFWRLPNQHGEYLIVNHK